jgi:histidyl-tRNA synthetase
MEISIDKQARGTRIIMGEEAELRRRVLEQLRIKLDHDGYQQIILPSIEQAEIYTDKAGPEILGQMYVFPDRKGRQLCLRPEGTATIQVLADTHWKTAKDMKLWYFEKCWRYERPQAGRYREFWQLGAEWINPRDPKKAREELIATAEWLVDRAKQVLHSKAEHETNTAVKRGLAYYVEDGFEISVPKLGAQKQVCGGGSYKQGIGFALGFDRLMMM